MIVLQHAFFVAVKVLAAALIIPVVASVVFAPISILNAGLSLNSSTLVDFMISRVPWAAFAPMIVAGPIIAFIASAFAGLISNIVNKGS